MKFYENYISHEQPTRWNPSPVFYFAEFHLCAHTFATYMDMSNYWQHSTRDEI